MWCASKLKDLALSVAFIRHDIFSDAWLPDTELEDKNQASIGCECLRTTTKNLTKTTANKDKTTQQYSHQKRSAIQVLFGVILTRRNYHHKSPALKWNRNEGQQQTLERPGVACQPTPAGARAGHGNFFSLLISTRGDPK
jgi:hypothetical protein